MAISANYAGSDRGNALGAAPGSTAGTWNRITARFGKSIQPKEMIFFTSQLSLMLEIGTPLNSALKAIGNQTENAAFKEVIQSMIRNIEEGRQLSDAMKQHPRVFNSIFTSMVKAGETGGYLKKILDRIVEILEKRQTLKTQVRSALTYPIALCIVAVLVIAFVLVWVLPRFTAFFEGKESVLPFTTRFLMTLSESLRGYWWAYILSGVGLVVCLKFCKETPMGRTLIDRFFVSGPLIARVSNKIYTCEFLRTLGNLMESQVPLLEALKVTRGTVRNQYFIRFIEQIKDHVQEGGKFSRPFATYPYILESVKQMVATGEEVGNLPKVMLRLATFYDTEVERELKNVASMIEPLALIVVGGVVGLIVSSVILPLFKLAHTIQ